MGTEIPIRETNRLPWSSGPPYRFAAMNPSGMPSETANNIAASASSTVAGNR